MKPQDHITILGILHIAWSLLLLAGVAVLAVLLLAGVLSGDEKAAAVLTVVAVVASTLLISLSALGIAGAWGLLKRRGWSRYMLLILGAIWSIKVPVGTALGVYTFYVLTREEVLVEFEPRPAAPAL